MLYNKAMQTDGLRAAADRRFVMPNKRYSKSGPLEKSPSGWWLGSYLEIAFWDDCEITADMEVQLAWINTVILRADTREEAYNKLINLAETDGGAFQSEDGMREGQMRFEGITELLPIYESLEDGAEIRFAEYKSMPLHELRSLTKSEHRVLNDDS